MPTTLVAWMEEVVDSRQHTLLTISKTIAITSLDLFEAKSCLWKRDLSWQFLAESSHVLEVSLEMGTFANISIRKMCYCMYPFLC